MLWLTEFSFRFSSRNFQKKLDSSGNFLVEAGQAKTVSQELGRNLLQSSAFWIHYSMSGKGEHSVRSL